MAGPRAVACARSGRGLRSRHAPSGPDRRDGGEHDHAGGGPRRRGAARPHAGRGPHARLPGARVRRGADHLEGTQLRGGPGDDVEVADDPDGFGISFNEGNAVNGTDPLVGGPGKDTVSYALRAMPVAVSLDGVANDGAPGERDDLRSIESIDG